MILNINAEVIRKIAEKLFKSQLISKLPLLNNSKRFIAFTLAEVLITLTIIGVVASLTIPVITRKTQDAQHKVAWKKIYSVIAQATNQLSADKDLDDVVVLFDSYEDVRDAYLPYFKYIKVCNAGSNLGNCWHKNDGSAKFLDGSDKQDFGDDPGIILADGAFLRFYTWGGDCPIAPGGVGDCGVIAADTNGFKGPNIIGKDIMYTYILNNSVLPYGVQGDVNEGSCNTSDTGYGCAAEFLYK